MPPKAARRVRQKWPWSGEPARAAVRRASQSPEPRPLTNPSRDLRRRHRLLRGGGWAAGGQRQRVAQRRRRRAGPAQPARRVRPAQPDILRAAALCAPLPGHRADRGTRSARPRRGEPPDLFPALIPLSARASSHGLPRATSSSKPSLSAAQEHRWHYFPGMRRDECLLFVSGDTAGGWPSVPHTAFAHPTTTADDPSRRSVEARVFVLYK